MHADGNQRGSNGPSVMKVNGRRPSKTTAKVKKWLVRSPVGYSKTADMLNRLPLLNEWRKGIGAAPYFSKRRKLYDYLSNDVVGPVPISYLEFGAYKGDSIRYWVESNTNPDREFIGFDTFEVAF